VFETLSATSGIRGACSMAFGKYKIEKFDGTKRFSLVAYKDATIL